MTLVTLVAGGDAAAREKIIAAHLTALKENDVRLAVILEGATQTDPFGLSDVQVCGLAPACPCCVGNLTLRVTLNRLLRQPPDRLFISMAQAAHLATLRDWLTQTPYDQHLTLTEHLMINDE